MVSPVIGNRSSGLQGYAIAQAAREAGARVTLVSGPVSIVEPAGVKVVRVNTAEEMLGAVSGALPADIFVAAAAVADWRVDGVGTAKIKKDTVGPPVLKLVENPDILSAIAHMSDARPRLVVGFAAETDNLIQNARNKLLRKGCDLIVANSVATGSTTFGGASNIVHIVTREGDEAWSEMSKLEVARRLIGRLKQLLDNHI